MNTRQFSKEICKNLGLQGITPKNLVYILDCVLVGITIVKVPNRSCYKLYFSIFPLWKSSLKECLDAPLFQKVIISNNGLDMCIADTLPEEEVASGIQLCLEQIPFFPSKDVDFSSLLRYLYNVTIQDPTIAKNFVLTLKVYQLIYNVALYCNDYTTAKDVYNVISEKISQWDDAIFQYWFGNKTSYINGLLNFEINRLNLITQLKCNLGDSKISKIPIKHLIFLEGK